MAKRTITKWWIWGLVVMAVGGILILASSLALAAHVVNVTAGGSSRYVPDNFLWTAVDVMILGGIVAGGGAIAQLVAWIGAVFNTHRLADKKWFHILLWGGIVGIVTSLLHGLGALGALFWLGVMACYLIAGNDGMAVQPPQVAMPTAPPKTLVP
jgi:hypothetical protein